MIWNCSWSVWKKLFTPLFHFCMEGVDELSFVREEKGTEYRWPSRRSRALYAVVSGWGGYAHYQTPLCFVPMFFTFLLMCGTFDLGFHVSARDFAFSSPSFPRTLTIAWWRNYLQSVLRVFSWPNLNRVLTLATYLSIAVYSRGKENCILACPWAEFSLELQYMIICAAD